MDTRKRILAVALIAALAGGVIGAFAFRAPGSSTEASTEAALPARAWESPSSEVSSNADRTYAGTDQIAYRDGFNDGFLSARSGGANSQPARIIYAQVCSIIFIETLAISYNRIKTQVRFKSYIFSDLIFRV